MKRIQQGFTLIELMIVVAIVGILAAIALPAYQDYVIRSKMSEGVAAAAACKTSISEYVSTKNELAGRRRHSGLLDAGHDLCVWLGGCGQRRYPSHHAEHRFEGRRLRLDADAADCGTAGHHRLDGFAWRLRLQVRSVELPLKRIA